MPNLNSEIIRSIPISFPPLPIQRRIADILGALGDKIECNRRINQTLEAMAQALYKHWFVDVQAERLPDGWEITTVGDLCEFAYGKGLKEIERVQGQYPVYGSAGTVGTHNEYLVRAPGIVVGRKGTIGQVQRARVPFFPIDTTFYIIPKAPEYSFDFLFLMLGRLGLEHRNNDSAVPGLNRNDVYTLPALRPPKAVLEDFNAKVAPLFLQIDSNENENQTLARTRDYLLPKLLSGEVEVKEQEEQLEKTL
jgi:type I restriction enzyme S subunit